MAAHQAEIWVEGDEAVKQAEHFRWNLLDPYNRLVSSAKKITQLSIVTADLPKTRLGKLKRHELAALARDGAPEPVAFTTGFSFSHLRFCFSRLALRRSRLRRPMSKPSSRLRVIRIH